MRVGNKNLVAISPNQFFKKCTGKLLCAYQLLILTSTEIKLYK